MEPARRLLAVAALVLLAGAAQAYYLPGTYPQEFLIGDVIQGEHLGGEVCLGGALARFEPRWMPAVLSAPRCGPRPPVLPAFSATPAAEVNSLVSSEVSSTSCGWLA